MRQMTIQNVKVFSCDRVNGYLKELYIEIFNIKNMVDIFFAVFFQNLIIKLLTSGLKFVLLDCSNNLNKTQLYHWNCSNQI